MMHSREWSALSDPDDGQLPIIAGDWVSTGLNILPRYQVIAVSGEKAWIRDAERGGDAIADLSRCHKIAGRADRARVC